MKVTELQLEGEAPKTRAWIHRGDDQMIRARMYNANGGATNMEAGMGSGKHEVYERQQMAIRLQHFLDGHSEPGRVKQTYLPIVRMLARS